MTFQRATFNNTPVSLYHTFDIQNYFIASGIATHFFRRTFSYIRGHYIDF